MLERNFNDFSRRSDRTDVRGLNTIVRPAVRGPGGSFATRLAALTCRPWGPEQVIGPPDTTEAGDMQTAWASQNPDGGAEWLKVDYATEVELAEVRVRETYNPGAVVRVSAVLADGSEALIWEGAEEPAKRRSIVHFR